MAKRSRGRGRNKRARRAAKASRGKAKRAARASKARKTASAKRRAPRGRKAASASRAASTPARPSTAQPKGRTSRPARSTRARTPALDRERRVLEEPPPAVPSSLNLDRHGSAARTGRAELQEKLSEHTETGPALTGGDIDADWEEAYSSGDEAPGGDNPTPDQGVVDDIGRSLGVEYEDNEELRSADKIASRDSKRWELDPASSEDYRDRNKK
jgi:hypothetical protein